MHNIFYLTMNGINVLNILSIEKLADLNDSQNSGLQLPHFFYFFFCLQTIFFLTSLTCSYGANSLAHNSIYIYEIVEALYND